MKAAILTHDGVVITMVDVADEAALECVLVGSHPKAVMPNDADWKVGDKIDGEFVLSKKGKVKVSKKAGSGKAKK